MARDKKIPTRRSTSNPVKPAKHVEEVRQPQPQNRSG